MELLQSPVWQWEESKAIWEDHASHQRWYWIFKQHKKHWKPSTPDSQHLMSLSHFLSPPCPASLFIFYVHVSSNTCDHYDNFHYPTHVDTFVWQVLWSVLHLGKKTLVLSPSFVRFIFFSGVSISDLGRIHCSHLHTSVTVYFSICFLTQVLLCCPNQTIRISWTKKLAPF